MTGSRMRVLAAGVVASGALVAGCSPAGATSTDRAALRAFVATWTATGSDAFRNRITGAREDFATLVDSLRRSGVVAFSVRSLRGGSAHLTGVLQLHFADGAILDSPMAASVQGRRVTASPALVNRALTSWQSPRIESFGEPRPGTLLSRQGTPLTIDGRAIRAGLKTAVALMERSLGGRVTGTLGRVLLSTTDGRELARVEPRDGVELRTSLDDVLQRRAEQSLGGRTGALVVVDPHDGSIRALADDPDPRHPGASPASDAHLPGSTFKIVTAAAAAEASLLDPDRLIDCPSRLILAGHTITNFEGEAGGRITIRQAFARSCNTAFARIGSTLGFARLVKAAHDLGIDAAGAAGAAPNTISIPKSVAEVATMAIGASTVAVTPIAMAEVVTTVARGGTRVPLHWDAASPRSTRVLTTSDARNLLSMMQAVVTSGTGRLAAIPGAAIAGKTGTADNLRPGGGVSSTDAWFVAIAPTGPARLVVACYLPGAGIGGETAAPLVRTFLESARDAWQ